VRSRALADEDRTRDLLVDALPLRHHSRSYGCEQLAQSRRTQPRPGRGGSNPRPRGRKSEAGATVAL